MTWHHAVNDFWFAELTPQDWFGGGSALDAKIKAAFEPLYDKVRQNPPEPADMDAHEHLAAVILFDQFPRNMFRGTAQAFATDTLAQAFAGDAVDHGLDRALDGAQRQFLYMPFMHAEDRDMQVRSRALFTALGQKEPLDFAYQHKGVIDRFGRFPQRNAALGRTSTPEEQKFLATTTYKW